jgi:hypothetical protein
MVLSDEQVKDFQTLYKSCFGKDISKEDAYENGIRLLRLVSLINKPMTKMSFFLFKSEEK